MLNGGRGSLRLPLIAGFIGGLITFACPPVSRPTRTSARGIRRLRRQPSGWVGSTATELGRAFDEWRRAAQDLTGLATRLRGLIERFRLTA